MSTANPESERASPSWFNRFWAVVRYEMLWNIRKKKFIGVLIIAFVLASVQFVLPAFLDIGPNPYSAITFSAGNLSFVLFAIVIAMNSISGEYESGTIVPLLTKPVSRTMVFLGKLFAIFVVLVVTYLLLFTYSTIGGFIVYGAQSDLHLLPLAIIGDVISTFIWIAIILAAGAISRSSLLAVLMAFGLFVALTFGTSIVASFSDNPDLVNAMNYLPGSGASGTLNITTGQNITISNVTINTLASVSSGTDSIGVNLVKLALFPDANASFYYRNVLSTDPTQNIRLLYTEPLGWIVARSILVAFAYIAVFLFIAWFAFKRSQIQE